MAASTKWLNLKRPWPLTDITSFSRMQKIKVTGASDLALLFSHQGCFCIAYQYFLWVVSITLCNNAYWIFEPFQVRRCNQKAEIKQLMCDIQGRRKEILTYTAMAKWLKPYRLMQKLNDYKRENIVCRAHMHTKHANTVGLHGGMMPQKILRNFDLYYCIFIVY